MKITTAADGTKKFELFVGKGGADQIKSYINFAFEHELGEIVKDDLRVQGKILSQTEIAAKVDSLNLAGETKDELLGLIEHRLFADKISLKTRPELLGEWKIENTELLSHFEDLYQKGEYHLLNSELTHLSYLKSLHLKDPAINRQLEEIVGRLTPTSKKQFNDLMNLMEEVTTNV